MNTMDIKGVWMISWNEMRWDYSRDSSIDWENQSENIHGDGLLHLFYSLSCPLSDSYDSIRFDLQSIIP